MYASCHIGTGLRQYHYAYRKDRRNPRPSSFETSCRELLDSGAKKVVVDLGGVEYISSAGLRVILTMVKASKAAAATLAFCSMQSMVAEVFKISGFSSMLPIYATRDEAVSALS